MVIQVRLVNCYKGQKKRINIGDKIMIVDITAAKNERMVTKIILNRGKKKKKINTEGTLLATI